MTDVEKDELSQLEELLSADIEKDGEEPNIESVSSGQKEEVDIFSRESNVQEESAKEKQNNSLIHNGDTDSSDDEDKRNCMNQKYNVYGSEVKKILETQDQEKRDKQFEFQNRLREANLQAKLKIKPEKSQQANTSQSLLSFNRSSSAKNLLAAPEIKPKVTGDMYTDPVFGIRIVKPLISSSSLLERMQGREAINMLRLKRHVEHGDLSKDWVTAGVIVRKSLTKKSQKGSQFTIWTLSDLRDDLKTVALFLFRNAYKEFWKTAEGTVIAVLNPSVLDKRDDSLDQACLSVDSKDKIMILGQSKDLGCCKSKKKNGEPCTAFVNTNQCEHCIYHVKQAHQKYSRRQELQSSTMGRGLVDLQNKVLGKNTVIYGGRSYSAIPIGKNKKISERDKNRLTSLSDYYNSTEHDSLMTNKSPSGGPIRKSAVTLNPTGNQRLKDLERLGKLQICAPSGSIEQLTVNPSLSNPSSLAEKMASSQKFSLNKPTIGFGLAREGSIDLSISYGKKAADRAKANAVKWIQQNGPLQKSDPHGLKGTSSGKKRAFNEISTSNNNSDCENPKKKLQKPEDYPKNGIMSERFKKILEATSAHQNLIQEHEDNEQDKYFSKLEKKEAMEEKMLNTFKIACKAVQCLKCKYTSFSAAERCKEEKHSLKVYDSFKRFFKCLSCGNRTVSLHVIPLHTCKNCKSSRWEKAPMMREKKGVSLADGLSIRGEEETFIGTIQAGKNINLLVPDD